MQKKSNHNMEFKRLSEHYTFVSELPPGILIEQLRKQVGKRFSMFGRYPKPYWGKIVNHSFKIQKDIYRGTITTIKGNITATDTGSIIQLAMEGPSFLSGFATLILVGTLVLSVTKY